MEPSPRSISVLSLVHGHNLYGAKSTANVCMEPRPRKTSSRSSAGRCSCFIQGDMRAIPGKANYLHADKVSKFCLVATIGLGSTR
ncbi:hypothetical protein RRG08_062345 [Elysia crispata]|uniref:Uncharacterized protein n=1 Tax=Elysia crispata TaxID=231223 RepID=A0AAE1CY40_9GAST|nr:hypothetical protein RRG08_062345 [Elysia crispata]